jgi:hypothetical protein
MPLTLTTNCSRNQRLFNNERCTATCLSSMLGEQDTTDIAHRTLTQ